MYSTGQYTKQKKLASWNDQRKSYKYLAFDIAYSLIWWVEFILTYWICNYFTYSKWADREISLKQILREVLYSPFFYEKKVNSFWFPWNCIGLFKFWNYYFSRFFLHSIKMVKSRKKWRQERRRANQQSPNNTENTNYMTSKFQNIAKGIKKVARNTGVPKPNLCNIWEVQTVTIIINPW